MNTFVQYLPGYVDGDRVQFEFDGVDSLLANPLIARWAEDGKFSHFATSGNKLMAILESGFKWWVVGFVKDPVPLPLWDGGKYKAQYADGSVRELAGDAVASVCGDVLTLKDGTQLERLSK